MGMSDKIKGKAEEMHGKMSNDKSMEMKGKARQELAKGKDKIDDMADETKLP